MPVITASAFLNLADETIRIAEVVFLVLLTELIRFFISFNDSMMALYFNLGGAVFDGFDDCVVEYALL